MKQTFGRTLIILGAILVAAALIFLLFNIREADEADKYVADVLPRLLEQIKAPPTAAADAEFLPDDEETPKRETIKTVDGNNYIGFLSVPSLNLELPVMSDWNYKRLKKAPCRYTGSAETNDLVIAAHNYARHFGMLKNLNIGDRLYFTDMDNTVYTYEVTVSEILSPTAIEEMTDSPYDITLFTCTYGGKSRVTIRANRIKNYE